MHVDDCVEGLIRLMESDHHEPLNIGRDRPVTVDELADEIMKIAGVQLEKKHVDGPVGVQWRNSDNSLCREVLRWEPGIPIEKGLLDTYVWIEQAVANASCQGNCLMKKGCNCD
jgi:nucleoside-diphosphate-sugar epimerase